MTVTARTAHPRRVPRLRFLGPAFLNAFLALNYVVSLYLPFVLFESANGRCTRTPCAATDQGSWWSFYAEDSAFEAASFRSFAALSVLLWWVLAFIVAPFTVNAVVWMPKGNRTERWLVVTSLLALLVAAVLFATPTGRRLYELVLD